MLKIVVKTGYQVFHIQQLCEHLYVLSEYLSKVRILASLTIQFKVNPNYPTLYVTFQKDL